MRKIIFIFLSLVILSTLSLVSPNGCCFYSDNGICTQNTLKDSCDSGGGMFSQDSSCAAFSECNVGCCMLGEATEYVTQRTCYVKSNEKGFEPNWIGGLSQDECRARAGGSDLGACVFSNGYENLCTHGERSKCSGTFHEGKVCSDESLDTICKKTQNTKCGEDGGVYYMDTCGNRDVLKQMCGYDEGYICQQKNSKEAYCKDLSCKDNFGNSRKNGESWCVGLEGTLIEEDVREVVFKKPGEKPEGFSDSVGSESFVQRCIDGKVVTEQCGIQRSEVCVPSGEGGGAQCIANGGNECLMAVPNPENPTDESWKEDCSSEWCYISRLDDCVSFGTEGHDMVCGEDRQNWRDYAATNGLSTNGVAEVTSPLLAELGILMCLPKISTGSDISSSSFSIGEGGVCSPGNFEKSTFMDHDKGPGKWFIKGDTKVGSVFSKSEDRYGNMGLISLISENWNIGESSANVCDKEDHPFFNKENKIVQSRDANGNIIYQTIEVDSLCMHEDNSIKVKTIIRNAISKGLIPDPMLDKLLNQRTIGLGDCAGSVNWVGVGGSSENSLYSNLKPGERTDFLTFSVGYESRSWSSPATGDCSKCGADGLPCTEYRCKAIAKSCEYKEPRGIDTGTCVSSSDMSPPTISYSQDPKNPIPPYESVLITLNTNEDSYCKFDFSTQGGTIEGLKYETGGRFGREHKFSLNVPGKAIYDEDIADYPLLTRDGKYQLHVRCEDAAGNYNVNAYIVNLDVMDTPDGVPPEIMEFIPSTNSYVEFNSTTKNIEFRLNEPAECRWDLEDKPYDLMGDIISDNEDDFIDEEEDNSNIPLGNTNQFLCDLDPSERSSVEGYWCSGTLTNVSTEVATPTKYYIRCKDQPMLEGREDNIYHRNVNDRSTEYILRASSPLEISEVDPNQRTLTIGGDRINITFFMRTKNGAENGKSVCEWRYTFEEGTTQWQIFNKTNSSTHEQPLEDLITSEYKMDVRCEDVAGNFVNGSYSFNIVRDITPPLMTRVYNKQGQVFLALDEFSRECKYLTNQGCSMVFTKGSLMSTSSNNMEFSTTMRKGDTYYMRCEDGFGNSRCFGDIFFY